MKWQPSFAGTRGCAAGDGRSEGVLERWILLPRFQPENAGLVTIWNENGAAIQFWKSMFERKAPSFIPKIEATIGKPIGQGNSVRDFDEELLSLLTEAYRAGVPAERRRVTAASTRQL